MTATFTARPSANTLRQQLLMDAQSKLEIGLRIKELRDNSPETNRSIAEFVDVGERSVAQWMAGGGITYDNAKRVAELFGVDVDYIWRGREKGETPDLMATFGRSESGEAREAVAALDAKLDRVLAQVAALAVEIGKVQGALQVQQAQPQPTSQRKAKRSS